MDATMTGRWVWLVLCWTILGCTSFVNCQDASTIATVGLSDSSSMGVSDLAAAGQISSSSLPGWPGGSEPEWNGLRVKYSFEGSSEASSYSTTVGDTGQPDPSMSLYQSTDSSSSSTWDPDNLGFDDMPRTVKAALASGWTRDENAAYFPPGSASTWDNATYTPWCGARLSRENGDQSVILMFDPFDTIVGLQSAIEANRTKHSYPSDVLLPPFVELDGQYYLSVYFIDPAVACSVAGRSPASLASEGTGSALWLLTAASARGGSFLKVQREEARVPAGFHGDRCAPGMGNHYFYNTTHVDMNCEDFAPFFVMYTRGRLTAFGFAFPQTFPGLYFESPTDYVSSAPTELMNFFLPQPIPNCWKERAGAVFSSLHVFLTNTALVSNICSGFFDSSTSL